MVPGSPIAGESSSPPRWCKWWWQVREVPRHPQETQQVLVPVQAGDMQVAGICVCSGERVHKWHPMVHVRVRKGRQPTGSQCRGAVQSRPRVYIWCMEEAPVPKYGGRCTAETCRNCVQKFFPNCISGSPEPKVLSDGRQPWLAGR